MTLDLTHGIQSKSINVENFVFNLNRFLKSFRQDICEWNFKPIIQTDQTIGGIQIILDPYIPLCKWVEEFDMHDWWFVYHHKYNNSENGYTCNNYKECGNEKGENNEEDKNYERDIENVKKVNYENYKNFDEYNFFIKNENDLVEFGCIVVRTLYTIYLNATGNEFPVGWVFNRKKEYLINPFGRIEQYNREGHITWSEAIDGTIYLFRSIFFKIASDTTCMEFLNDIIYPWLKRIIPIEYHKHIFTLNPPLF